MFHQDLSFSRNLLSSKDKDGRSNWSLFYENTMAFGDFNKMLKRQRMSEAEARALCPGTPYASNSSFRNGLFKYFSNLRGEQKQKKSLSIASYLINVDDKWMPVSSEQEYRNYYLKSITLSVSLRTFNNAYRANNLSINGESISSYVLRSGIDRK